MSPDIVHTDSFEELRRRNGVYVDKTFLLDDLLHGHKVSLFTRPHLFGKTLFLSTLASFLDITKDSRELFAGLQVGADDDLCDRWMNRFPVFHLGLKGVGGEDLDDALKSFEARLAQAAEPYRELLVSDEDCGGRFRSIFAGEADMSTLEQALYDISSVLRKRYDKKVVLLIDDYDDPLITALKFNYYDFLHTFIDDFIQRTFKENKNIKLSFITGITNCIDDEFTEDNKNFCSYSMLDCAYSNAFGFTESEVTSLLADFNLEEKKDVIRKWYGGYRCGERTDIHCPGSVLLSLAALREDPAREPAPFWTDTGGKLPVWGYINHVPSNLFTIVRLVFDGHATGSLEDTIDWSEAYDSKGYDFPPLLLHTGHLTFSRDPEEPDKDWVKYFIPNEDARAAFTRVLVPLLDRWTEKAVPEKDRKRLVKAFWQGDTEAVENILGGGVGNCCEEYAMSFLGRGFRCLLVRDILRVCALTVTGPDVAYPEPNDPAGSWTLVVTDGDGRRAAVVGVVAGEPVDFYLETAMRGLAEGVYDAGLKARGFTEILHWGLSFVETECQAVCERPGQARRGKVVKAKAPRFWR